MSTGTLEPFEVPTIVAGVNGLLRDILAAEAPENDITIVADVADLSSLTRAASDCRPQVVIIDAPRGLDPWLADATALHADGIGVVVITDATSPEDIVSLLAAGVDGLLRSDTSPSEVMRAARTVGTGGVVLHDDIAAIVLHQWRAQRGHRTPLEGHPRSELTARESEVLQAMADGLSTKAIARRLEVALKTVENHKTRVFQKLGARSNAHAVSMAIRMGLLGLPDGDADSPGAAQ
jgi:two-component system nitrate/nitrite response regulator NarL